MRPRLLALVEALRPAWCRHPDMVRERIGGVWYFVCVCGHRTPVLRRDA
jgi:hypothetical protein